MGNYGSLDNYEPNGFGGPVEDPAYAEPPLKISGDADRYNSHENNDDYTQAGNLFRLFSPEEQGRLMDNIASTMQTVPEETQRVIVEYFRKCDSHYGDGIAQRLGLK